MGTNKNDNNNNKKRKGVRAVKKENTNKKKKKKIIHKLQNFLHLIIMNDDDATLSFVRTSFMADKFSILNKMKYNIGFIYSSKNGSMYKLERPVSLEILLRDRYFL